MKGDETVERYTWLLDVIRAGSVHAEIFMNTE